MEQEQISFSFGKNWQEFLDGYFSAERVELAKQHLLNFLEVPDLAGKSFVDIGCGSGLSSLAAYEAGAQSIISFDIDPYSVASTKKLREIAGSPAYWSILQGSILDQNFLKTLEKANIVYSWGVLHHTGDLWNAVEQAATLLAADGLFYIALYTTNPKSAYWLRVKQKYNRASPVKKRFMEVLYILRYTIRPLLLQRKNPIRHIQEYKKKRGMAYITDVRDWLGGYPYEYAKIEEVLRFARRKLFLELINLKTGGANTEYLFMPRIHNESTVLSTFD